MDQRSPMGQTDLTRLTTLLAVPLLLTNGRDATTDFQIVTLQEPFQPQ